MHDTPDGMLVQFDPADDILVAGIHQLAANDFLFA